MGRSVPPARAPKHKNAWWSVDEARAFLESARTGNDPLYAEYVLVLVLGLRRGEVLGLMWDDINLDAAEVTVTWQLQRSRSQPVLAILPIGANPAREDQPQRWP